MATDAQGWSSLPADLVNRVADCVLADNDLDYYMAMRAVCHGWRSSTADPKTSHDVRFHPTRWIVLDELSSESDTRLFVNTTTGRFLRRRLPLLRDYHLVTSTTGSGFLVLAEKEPPHAARVLNPFTGSLIRFRAPMPSKLYMAADVVGNSPTLVVYSSSDELRFFHAAPESEQFFEVRLDAEPEPRSVEPSPPLQSDTSESEVPFGRLAISFLVLRCPAVKLASGEVLRVCRSPQQGVHLLSMKLAGAQWTTERVHSIGGQALFVGATRCMFVHADSFPSINANCIYYKKVKRDGSSGTYMHDLAHDKEERVDEPNICIYPALIPDLADDTELYPASILRLLAEYTACSPRYKPVSDELDQFNKMLLDYVLSEEGMMQAQMLFDSLKDVEVDPEDFFD
ncbi:unnamed protein product [Urochloa humidicola]